MKLTLKNRQRLFSITLFGFDLILVFILIGLYVLLFNSFNPLLLWLLVIQFAVTLLIGGYKTRKNWDIVAVQVFIFRALALQAGLVLILIPFVRWVFQVNLQGSILLMSSSTIVILILLIGLSRLIFHSVIQELYRKSYLKINLVVMGPATELENFQKRLDHNPWMGINIESTVGWNEIHSSKFIEMFNKDSSADIDGIWFLKPGEIAASAVEKMAEIYTRMKHKPPAWYLFSRDAEAILNQIFSNLTQSQRVDFTRQLIFVNDLPIHRIAMLGSRGVPANYSGIETYIEEVGKHLVEAGNQVTVYCHKKYVSRRGEFKGMRLRFLPTIRSKHLETFVHTLLASVDVLFREIEIVHYHAQGPATFAWIPRFFGRKVVSCVQGLDWARAKWGRLARLYLKIGEKASVWFPHETVVVSRVLADHYQQQYNKSVTVIPNGFTPPHPRPANHIHQFNLEKDNYYLFVGRLVPEKSIHTLIEAFRKTNSQRSLVIAGRATFANKYHNHLLQLAEGDERIVFTGYQTGETLQELFTNPYAIIHPSELEGLSIALLEGFSYGNCILISDRPENIEAVDGVGITFRSGDLEDLRNKIQTLDDNPDLVASYREKAREKLAQKLDWQSVARENMLIYDRLSSKGGEELAV